MIFIEIERCIADIVELPSTIHKGGSVKYLTASKMYA